MTLNTIRLVMLAAAFTCSLPALADYGRGEGVLRRRPTRRHRRRGGHISEGTGHRLPHHLTLGIVTQSLSLGEVPRRPLPD